MCDQEVFTALCRKETGKYGKCVIRKFSLHCAGNKLENMDTVQPVDGFKEQ
jgi:hypothetical protein